MNKPLVSICMPAYNAEDYAAVALESVLRQTYEPLEVIVVNDGSTDKTEEVLREFEKQGVKVISQENKGQCAAANRAFAAAKGDLIKFFDADDLLSPQAVESQVVALAESKESVACCGWGRFFNDNPETAVFNPEPTWRDMTPLDWLVSSLEHGTGMMQCGIWLIPRAILDKSGLWDERLSLINDFDFFIRVLLNSKEVLFTPEAKLYYRSGVPNSLSGQGSRASLESAILSLELGAASLLSAEDSSRTRSACAKMFQVWAYNCYPDCPDLAEQAEKKVKELGGSSHQLPGNFIVRMLNRLFGWKIAKRAQLIARKLGWSSFGRLRWERHLDKEKG